MTETSSPTADSRITKRYDFVLLMDVTNGNPNGDPDANNAPRTDPETGHGIMTDVCVKRKIRNWVALSQANEAGGEPGMGIYVQHGTVLAAAKGAAYAALGLAPTDTSADEGDPAPLPDAEDPAPAAGKKVKRQPNKKAADIDKVLVAQRFMAENYWDVRTFGAVMGSKSADCGQLRGAVQLTFAESIDPVVPQQVTLTRCAVETQRESEAQGGQNKTMGTKWIVPYGLYRAHGFVTPSAARVTGFSERDLEVLWKAIVGMFEIDRSAARGMMAVRKLIVFEHASALGNAPAHVLFERVVVKRKDGIQPARSFKDYDVNVHLGAINGVTIRTIV